MNPASLEAHSWLAAIAYIEDKESDFQAEVAKVREAGSAERAAVFYRQWVRHEARLKCLGVGLTGTAPATPVEVQDLDVAPGYAAAVAVG